MNMIDVLKDECIALNRSYSNKVEVLEDITKLAKECSVFKDIESDRIFNALSKREKLTTTGFGNGIAIPHCQLDEVKEFVVGLITVPDGVDFNALDGKKVKLIIFIIGPTEETNKHIKILSEISRALRIPGVVQELVAARDKQILKETFLKNIRDNILVEDSDKKRIIQVFVQDSDKMKAILEELLSLNPSSLIVLDGENAHNYLVKIPLLAGFWRDNKRDYCKIILATISKKLSNEAIRRIKQISDDINEPNNMLIIVQDVVYITGEIEF
ncbi:hypothetical protein DRQ33_01785 [bacterium]|nr:MAG: hypothetical protein DRQ33_01785 [bacterium]